MLPHENFATFTLFTKAFNSNLNGLLLHTDASRERRKIKREKNSGDRKEAEVCMGKKGEKQKCGLVN